MVMGLKLQRGGGAQGNNGYKTAVAAVPCKYDHRADLDHFRGHKTSEVTLTTDATGG